jgi:hypothetical protein
MDGPNEPVRYASLAGREALDEASPYIDSNQTLMGVVDPDDVALHRQTEDLIVMQSGTRLRVQGQHFPGLGIEAY